mgnify:CR=1 FL=1
MCIQCTLRPDPSPPRRRQTVEARGDAGAERSQHRARCNRRRRGRRRCCRRRCHRRRCSRCCRRRRAHGSAKARPANWQPIRWRHSGDHPIPLGEIHQPDGERAAGVPLRPGPHGCATAGRLHAVDNACRLRNAAGTIAAVPCSPARVQKLAPSNDFITSFPCADGACCGCLWRQRRSPWPHNSAFGARAFGPITCHPSKCLNSGSSPSSYLCLSSPLTRASTACRRAHAMHMPCTCHAHAMHRPCTCHAHAMHMLCICHAHMLCTCHAHAMHMPCTYHAHTMHIPCRSRAPSSCPASSAW